MSDKIIHLTDDSFDTDVLKADGLTLGDFWAEWCGPCQTFFPILHSYAEKTDAVKIGKINVDEEQELAVKFRVMSIPTLLIFKNGKVEKSFVGARDKKEIVDISEKIDTYDTSIQPYEDCCTIFVAKHPVTKPNLERIEKSERNLDEKIDELMQTAIDTVETIMVK